jgi:hypothetical protein
MSIRNQPIFDYINAMKPGRVFLTSEVADIVCDDTDFVSSVLNSIRKRYGLIDVIQTHDEYGRKVNTWQKKMVTTENNADDDALIEEIKSIHRQMVKLTNRLGFIFGDSVLVDANDNNSLLNILDERLRG